MSWTLENIQSLINKISNDRRKAQLEWNEKFPPSIEVDAVEDAGTTTTYGIWKVSDGIFVIPKSKSGYQPECRICLSTEIVEAIRSIT